jgi:hypothetical protein
MPTEMDVETYWFQHATEVSPRAEVIHRDDMKVDRSEYINDGYISLNITN